MLQNFSTGRGHRRKRTVIEGDMLSRRPQHQVMRADAVLNSMMFSPTTSDSYRNNDPMMHTSPEDTHRNMIL